VPEQLAPSTPAPDAAGLLLDGLAEGAQCSLLGDPTKAYLDSLTSERSRQTAREHLRAAARVIGLDPAEAQAFPWHRLRFQHIDFIRSRLSEKDPITDKRRAPATINLTLSILRGIARYARNMNVMSDEEYRRIGEVKPATGERQPRRARSWPSSRRARPTTGRRGRATPQCWRSSTSAGCAAPNWPGSTLPTTCVPRWA